MHSINHNEEAEEAEETPSGEAAALTLTLANASATDALGAALAQALPEEGGLLIALQGELGVGKTALVRAMLRALGYAGPVKSPTYALVELYKFSRLCLYHFDFYRFNDPEEFVDAGLAEYFNENAVCCVEWPDKALGVLPQADLLLHLSVVGSANAVGNDAGANADAGGSRRVFLQCFSARGEACLNRLQRPVSIVVAGS